MRRKRNDILIFIQLTTYKSLSTARRQRLAGAIHQFLKNLSGPRRLDLRIMLYPSVEGSKKIFEVSSSKIKDVSYLGTK